MAESFLCLIAGFLIGVVVALLAVTLSARLSEQWENHPEGLRLNATPDELYGAVGEVKPLLRTPSGGDWDGLRRLIDGAHADIAKEKRT